MACLRSQRFNRTHARVGHVFKGRFKAILVDKDSYLLELARYVVLNPLRAKMVRRVERWRWSSYPATCGQAAKPDWLQVDFVPAQFAIKRTHAIEHYVAFVLEGARLPSALAARTTSIRLDVSRLGQIPGSEILRKTPTPRRNSKLTAQHYHDRVVLVAKKSVCFPYALDCIGMGTADQGMVSCILSRIEGTSGRSRKV